jgi:hypothetical protein
MYEAIFLCHSPILVYSKRLEPLKQFRVDSSIGLC